MSFAGAAAVVHRALLSVAFTMALGWAEPPAFAEAAVQGAGAVSAASIASPASPAPAAGPASTAGPATTPAVASALLTSSLASNLARPPVRTPEVIAAAGSRVVPALRFLVGGAAGLLVHEAGHVSAGLALGARPSVGALRYGPIRFFAIRHADVSRRKEFVISSAGFWMQHAGSEWLLTARPGLRSESAPVLKGILAFNVTASAVYGVAAFGSFGPPERDTLGMARSLGQDGRSESIVGALVLAPALLDAYRYFEPDARWAAWASRGVKAAGLALVVFAGR